MASSSSLQNDMVSSSILQNDMVSSSILQNDMVSSSILQNDMVYKDAPSSYVAPSSSSILQNDMAYKDAPSSYVAPSCSSSQQYDSSDLSLFLNPDENFSLLDYINNNNNEPIEMIMDSADFEYLKNSQLELLDLNQYLIDPPLESPPSKNQELIDPPSENPELIDPPSENLQLCDPPSENLQLCDPPSVNLQLSDTDELKLALELMFILNKLFQIETGRWKRKHDGVCWDAAYTIRKLENKIKDLDHRFKVKLKKIKAKFSMNAKRQNEKIFNMMNEPTPKRIKKTKKCTMCD